MIDISKLKRDYINNPLKLNNRKFELPNKDDLYELYINQNLNKSEICEYLKVSDSILKKFLKEYDIKKPTIHISKEELEELYINQNLTRETVADYFGVNITTITNYCRLYNIGKSQSLKFENYKKTMNKKYNVDNGFQLNDIKNKSKSTCLAKYGVEHYQSTNEYKNKVKQTKLEKYGDENYNNTQKTRETCLERYGITVPSMKQNKKEFYELLESKEKTIEFIKTNDIVNIKHMAKIMGMKEGYIQHKINEYNLKGMFDYSKSLMEKELQDIIKNYYPDSINNYILEKHNELDIYIPELKLGIEFDGNYWHSEEVKGKLAQINKTKIAEKYDIFVYHIFEYEWVNKKDKVINQLKNLLHKNLHKIGARQCIIKTIDSNTKNKFLEENHLQGADRCNVAYGLYYNDELVSIMTFIKPRFNKKYQWELSRYATKSNYNVCGAASRLFNNFIKEYNPSTILSYSDMAKTKGNLYKKLGFVLDHISEPNYIWLKSNKLYKTRYQCQKHKLNELGLFGKSETDIMKSIGFYKIYDCGNKVWVWNNQTNVCGE